MKIVKILYAVSDITAWVTIMTVDRVCVTIPACHAFMEQLQISYFAEISL